MVRDETQALILDHAVPVKRGWGGTLLRRARQKPLGVVALALLAAIWLLCLFAPVIAPYPWNQVFAGPRLQAPSAAHLLGTDQVGQDVFSRLLYGGRLTLTISLVATVAGVTLATVIGVLSGYALGTFDLLIQRLSDGVQAMPGLIVLMVVAAVFSGSLGWTMAMLVVLTAPSGARLLRSATLGVRQSQYIEAARTLGASHPRVLLRHILPNVAPLMIILFSLSAGANLLLLAALSFLGVINATYPDWGTMLNASAQTYMVGAPWLAVAPGLAISLTVLSYNLLGDMLRDVLDPRLRI
jgi:ABC-type dipeptide/oligopeptide/nickel transport system permease subunit